MKYYIAIDTKSADKRVGELMKIATKSGLDVCDWSEEREGKRVVHVLPRGKYDGDGLVFDYARLSKCDKFVKENNYLTALAQKELLVKKFGRTDLKILIIGYGKLTAELEKVLADADIHILQFNAGKVEAVRQKYGDKAYFETAPLDEFPVIINTVPKAVVKVKKQLNAVIYELASAPYGFDWGKLDVSKMNYLVEPGLPGRFYPQQAAQAVFDCIVRIMGERKTLVLCLTASSCCFERMLPVVEELRQAYEIVPVMSENALKPNRFVDIEQFKVQLRELCGNNIITTIAGCEVLSARKDVVASVVIPATGNTIAKLAGAITDTPITMAVKALLRNSKPCIIGISTNDALSGNASNIGLLLNRKNYFFVPFGQDDYINKPFSMVCDFGKVVEAVEGALQGKQVQPIVFC
jgi:dipicolinate synthase subunit B